MADNQEYHPFEVQYPYAGGTWTFELLATSHEDAEKRVAAMAWAKVDGQIMEKIPASVPRWYVRARCWWANWRRANAG